MPPEGAKEVAFAFPLAPSGEFAKSMICQIQFRLAGETGNPLDCRLVARLRVQHIGCAGPFAKRCLKGRIPATERSDRRGA